MEREERVKSAANGGRVDRNKKYEKKVESERERKRKTRKRQKRKRIKKEPRKEKFFRFETLNQSLHARSPQFDAQ
jgi:hypothetical protein